MAEIKTGIFAKNVQKRLNRAQEKVLQKLGKADETKDEQFEQVVVNFRRQESEGSRLQREMKSYMAAIKGMQQASINLTQSLHEVYEPDWHGKDDVLTIGKDCDALWEDFHNKLVDSTLLNLDEYLLQFPDLKTRVAKRSRKLIDFDSARHHVETLQISGMKNDRKMVKAEDELKKAQRVFDELNVGLQNELPTLWDSRVGFYISTYKSVTNLEARFHREISQVCRQLYEVMTQLAEQHSDKMFTIQGAPSDSGPLRLARTPSPPEDESPPESPDASSNHMLRPVSPGPPRPKSPAQLKKGPPVPPPPKVTPTKEVAEEQIIDLFGGEFLPAPSPSQPNERPGESLLDLDFDAFQPDESVSPIPQTAVPWDMWSADSQTAQPAPDSGFFANWSADFASFPFNGAAASGAQTPSGGLEGAQGRAQGGTQADVRTPPQSSEATPAAEDEVSGGDEDEAGQADSDRRKSTPGLVFTNEYGEQIEGSTGDRADKLSRSPDGSGSEYETAEEWGGGWASADDELSHEDRPPVSDGRGGEGVEQVSPESDETARNGSAGKPRDLVSASRDHPESAGEGVCPLESQGGGAFDSEPSAETQGGGAFDSDPFAETQGGGAFDSFPSAEIQGGGAFDSDPFAEIQGGGAFAETQGGGAFDSFPSAKIQGGGAFDSDTFAETQGGGAFAETQGGGAFDSDPFAGIQGGGAFDSDPFAEMQGGGAFAETQGGGAFDSDPFAEMQGGGAFDSDPFAEMQGGGAFDSDPFAEMQGGGAFDSDPFAEMQGGGAFDSDPFAEMQGGGAFDSDPFAETKSGDRGGACEFVIFAESSGAGGGIVATGDGSGGWGSDLFVSAASSGTEVSAPSSSSWQGLRSAATGQNSASGSAAAAGGMQDINTPRIHKEPENSDMSEDEAANRRFGKLYQELDKEKEEATDAFNGFSQDATAPSFFADFDKMNKVNAEAPEAPATETIEEQDKLPTPPAGEEPAAPPAGGEVKEPAASPAGGEVEEPAAFPVGVEVEEPAVSPPGGELEEPAAFPVGVEVEEPAVSPPGGELEEPAAFPVGVEVEEPAASPPGGELEEPAASPVGVEVEEPAVPPVGGEVEEPAASPVGVEAEEPEASPVGVEAEEPAVPPVGGEVEKPAAPPAGGEVEEPAAPPVGEEMEEPAAPPVGGEMEEPAAPTPDEEEIKEASVSPKEENPSAPPEEASACPGGAAPSEKMPIPSVVIEPASSNEGDDDRDADIISPTAVSDNDVAAGDQTMTHMSGGSGLPDDFLYKVETMHDFEAANSDELDLKRGDVVLVVPTASVEDQDAGWLTGIKESDWLAQGTGAQKGLFPENFTQRLE